MAQCDNHSFTLPVHRGRRGNGNFVDYYKCRKCETVLYVESDPVSQRQILTRNLKPGDDWTAMPEDVTHAY